MGYSQYFVSKQETFSDAFTNAVKKLAGYFPDIAEISVQDDIIMVDDLSDDPYETFVLEPTGRWGACKTRGNPYDAAICTALAIAAVLGEVSHIGSDGYNQRTGEMYANWDLAISLAGKILKVSDESVEYDVRRLFKKYYAEEAWKLAA